MTVRIEITGVDGFDAGQQLKQLVSCFGGGLPVSATLGEVKPCGDAALATEDPTPDVVAAPVAEEPKAAKGAKRARAKGAPVEGTPAPVEAEAVVEAPVKVEPEVVASAIEKTAAVQAEALFAEEEIPVDFGKIRAEIKSIVEFLMDTHGVDVARALFNKHSAMHNRDAVKLSNIANGELESLLGMAKDWSVATPERIAAEIAQHAKGA